jgi:hypothetical protein
VGTHERSLAQFFISFLLLRTFFFLTLPAKHTVTLGHGSYYVHSGGKKREEGKKKKKERKKKKEVMKRLTTSCSTPL